MKTVETPEYLAMYRGPGMHFAALAFAKLVRLGGAADRSKFNPKERKRFRERLIPYGYVEEDGRMFAVTCQGWRLVQERTEQMVLDNPEWPL